MFRRVESFAIHPEAKKTARNAMRYLRQRMKGRMSKLLQAKLSQISAQPEEAVAQNKSEKNDKQPRKKRAGNKKPKE